MPASSSKPGLPASLGKQNTRPVGRVIKENR
jgi:hypothetical protein